MVWQIIIERRILEEDCRRQSRTVYHGLDANGQPFYGEKEAQLPFTKVQREERLAVLEQDVSVERPPDACDARIRAVHEAVVTKLTEYLEVQATTGTVAPAVSKSGAPTTSFVSEDVFQVSARAALDL
jgi:hypothetical protein